MAQKKKTAYQQLLEEETDSGGAATNRPKGRKKNVTGTGNTIEAKPGVTAVPETTNPRPQSREKYIGGPHGKYGLPIETKRLAPHNPEKQRYNDEPLQTTGKRKEAAAATVKKPISRKKKVTGIATLGPTKRTSGRKF